MRSSLTRQNFFFGNVTKKKGGFEAFQRLLRAFRSTFKNLEHLWGVYVSQS